MDKEAWEKWWVDAYKALRAKYDEKQSTKIVDWFYTIKASKEIALVGEEKMNALRVLYEGPHFDLYHSLMYRMWVYAPYIIAEKD